MFARIKRFFLAFRLLRQKARTKTALRHELNLDRMSQLVEGMLPEAPIDQGLNMGFTVLMKAEGKPATAEDVKRVLAESKVDGTQCLNRVTQEGRNQNNNAERRLDEHRKKFRS